MSIAAGWYGLWLLLTALALGVALWTGLQQATEQFESPKFWDCVPGTHLTWTTYRTQDPARDRNVIAAEKLRASVEDLPATPGNLAHIVDVSSRAVAIENQRTVPVQIADEHRSCVKPVTIAQSFGRYLLLAGALAPIFFIARWVVRGFKRF